MSAPDKTALVLLAPGAEEMEVSIIVDVLRRGGVKVTLAGVAGSGAVTCSRGLRVVPDVALGDVAGSFDAVVLPGGAQGAENLGNSPLVGRHLKTQWQRGRIVAAVGKAGEAADRDKLAIWLGDILVANDGAVAPAYREQQGAAYMKGPEIAITVDVGVGKEAATIWTCDLTHDYIGINADYRS